MNLSLMTAKAKAFAAILVLSVTFMSGWVVNGWRLDAAHTKTMLEAKDKENEKLSKVIEDYKTLGKSISDIDQRWSSKNDEIKQKIDQLSIDYLTGNKRLSVLVQKRNDSTAMPGVSSPSMDNGTETAYLDGRVAAGLTRLTGRGDQAIIQLNACQDILLAVQNKDREALANALEKFSSQDNGKP